MFNNFYIELGDNIYETFISESRYKMFIDGLFVSLQLTAIALLIGIILGLLIALFRIRRVPVLSEIADAYVNIIRGTPANVQLMIIYFMIFVTAPSDMKIYIGSLAFGINSGAYVSEIIRGGIQSVDKGQMEASRSLGLSYSKSMRLVIIPQALKNILPALGNEFIVLLKETAVAGYIGLTDLTKAAQFIGSTTYNYVPPLLTIAYLYFILTLMFAKLIKLLERRMGASD